MNSSRTAQKHSLQHDGMYYLDFFSLLNETHKPNSYFEIGTSTGDSLQRFDCDAACVDPNFQIASHVWRRRQRTLLFQMTSDEFFAKETLRNYFPKGPDLCFLDGMHLFENILRDFINTEKASHPGTMVLIHDALPVNLRMAERVPRQGSADEGLYHNAWTGDVWRVIVALNKYRPDLRIRLLNTPPTGLVAITSLDHKSRVLSDKYDQIIADSMKTNLNMELLERVWDLYPMIDTANYSNSPDKLVAELFARG